MATETTTHPKEEPEHEAIPVQNRKRSTSPDPEDDDERFMMFKHYDKSEDSKESSSAAVKQESSSDEDSATRHVIPKSPAVHRSISMRGRGFGGGHHPHHPPTPGNGAHPDYYYHPHPTAGYAAAAADYPPYHHYGESPNPAAALKAGQAITPGPISPPKPNSYYMYPPSSPIKASYSIDLTAQEEEQEDGEEEMGEEWMPPPSSLRKEVAAAAKGEEGEEDAAPAQAEGGRGGSKQRQPPPQQQPHHYPPHHPPTPRSYYSYGPPPYGQHLSSRSKSADSSESPYQLPPGAAGGRVQLVGAGHEWDGLQRTGSWSLVSRSRSIESGGSGELWEPPRPMRNPMAPTPGRPPISGDGGSGGIPFPPSPYAGYPPPPHAQGTPERPPYSYATGGGGGGYDHPHSYGGGARYPPHYPPHHSYYPPHPDEELSHPLLKDYNPHADSVGVRPQFTNHKKTPKRSSQSSSSRSLSPARRRRRRNPDEKAAAAAAMAAAAKAAAEKEASLLKAGGKDDDDTTPLNGTVTVSEKELKALGSGDDEDIPAAKRAAMASAVALRAAAAGAKLEPPKSSREVNFDIVQPPLVPVVPPGLVPLLKNTSLMGENDVLCGRGGGTNSQMGNRRFRALVRDFQPTYLMAKRREKPLMARSVVLIVRHRGGRFLRRDDVDGRLYEVGDEKAEAKTSQALREGLDVRATKTAANTLLGAESSSKKKKRSPTNAVESSDAVKKPTKPAPVTFPPPRVLPTYMPRGPPLPPRNPYYYGHPPPPPPGYERGPPPGSVPPYPPPNYRGYHPPAGYPGYPPARPPPAPMVSPPRSMSKTTPPKST